MNRYPRYRHHEPHRGPRSKPVLIVTAIALLAVLVLAVISTVSKVSSPQSDSLVVGTNTPFPPFEARKGEKVVGFDIDLAERIAASMGRKLVIKDFSEFDALLPALESEAVDMVISAVTIRDDREEVIDFSNSYFEASQAVLAAQGAALSYSGDPNDFKGLKVGYQEGTTSQFWVEEHLLDKVSVASLTPFGDIAFGLQLLQLGSVDAIIIDEPAASALAKSRAGLEVRGVIETDEDYGIAVREGDPQKLLPAINAVLSNMEETGEYDALIVKWFGGGE